MLEVLTERETLKIRDFGRFEILTRRMTGTLPKWAKKTDIDKLDNYAYIKFTPSENLKRSLYTGIPIAREHALALATQRNRVNRRPPESRMKNKTDRQVTEDAE